jgi:hypothetical protein
MTLKSEGHWGLTLLTPVAIVAFCTVTQPMFITLPAILAGLGAHAFVFCFEKTKGTVII